MENCQSLAKEERARIFSLFLNKNKLKFSDIEKGIKIRSNMIAYHLQRMRKEGIIQKRKEYYYLTKNAEKYIPIFSQLFGKKIGPLPVILIAVINKNEILLIKRNKRPYKNYWSLIGGKMLFEENFKDASLRKVKEKSSLDGKFVSTNAVLHERVEGEDIIKHSFILFFTKLKTNEKEFKETRNGKLKWFKIKDIEKKKIIPSDLWLIKNKLSSRMGIKSAKMYEDKGRLKSFELVD